MFSCNRMSCFANEISTAALLANRNISPSRYSSNESVKYSSQFYPYPMSGQGPPGSSPQPFVLYTPAVDFIENRMSQYHEAFDTSGFRYSPNRNQFVALAPPPGGVMQPPGPSSLTVPYVPAAPEPRPTPGSINDMGFWGVVFPVAMRRLNEEPLPRAGYQPQWGIRHLSVWRDVQAKLDMAQREYDFHHGSKNVGKFRRKLRDVLDKVTVPIQQAVGLIPDVDLASPVIGVVNMLLDVSGLPHRSRSLTRCRAAYVNQGLSPSCRGQGDR